MQTEPPFSRIAPNVKLGRDVRMVGWVNLYGCAIGDETRIGPFVEVQKGAAIGKRCKVSSHAFICEGVTIEDECFIGHGVMFINDKNPVAAQDGRLTVDGQWQVEKTLIRKGASIGSGAVILSGLTVGEGALIGAGAVVTHDVPPRSVVAGVPARRLAAAKARR
ncbi:MAG: acyltransferase [Elusimicrobia bacterium]|nr:acyltransferase [Elusimicrobiota bacterium]